MVVPRWLAQEWQERLVPVLDLADREHPEVLQEIFAQVLADWRARPRMSANTLATYVTMTRDWIRSLPLTAQTSVINPKTKEAEHVALISFTLTQEEWAAGKVLTMKRVGARNVQMQTIADPGPLVEQIHQVLARPQWEAIAAGLAAATGRRIGEVLLSGSIEPKTAYTLWFVGRLKMKGRPDQRFEIPTVVSAQEVEQAWERLRAHPDLLAMGLPQQVNTRAVGEINRRLYPRVRRAVAQFFGDLVPGLDEEGAAIEVSTHRLRSVYAALAVWAYCPLWVDPDRYAAAVLGHGLFSGNGVEQLNPSTEEYYHRYVVQDGRRGVWLDRPEVAVLERFAQPNEKELPLQTKQVRKGTSKKKRHEPPSETKTGYSMLRPSVGMRREIFAIAQDLGIEWLPDDEVLKVLVRSYRQQHGAIPQPKEQEITANGLGLEGEEAALAQEASRLWGKGSFEAFVRHAVERESKRLVSFSKSMHEKQNTSDFAEVPTSKLEGIRRAPEAYERLRRAIATLVDYNLGVADPNLLWYINQKLLRDLTGAAPEFINRVLVANQDYLEQHHQTLSITPAHNRIPTKKVLKEVIQIPEWSASLVSLGELVVPSTHE
jgi:hypothetical protein